MVDVKINQGDSTTQESHFSSDSQFQYARGLLIFQNSNDSSNGNLSLLKTSNQLQPFKTLSLCQGSFLESNKNGNDIERLKETFTLCSSYNQIKTQAQSKVSKGFIAVAKAPIKLADLIILSLEKIGDGARATPYFMTGQNCKGSKIFDRVDVSTIIDGIAYGSVSMIKEILGAVAGIVLDPILGAKSKGFKGGAQGFGKGLLGLIFKPVAGTIDLVTYTTRGLGKTPKTIHQRIKKIVNKRRMKSLLVKQKFTQPPIRPYIPSEQDLQEQEKKRLIRLREQQQAGKFKYNDQFCIGQTDLHQYYININDMKLNISKLQEIDVNQNLFQDFQDYEGLSQSITKILTKFIAKNENKSIEALIDKISRVLKQRINHFNMDKLDKGIVSLLQIDEDDEFSSESSVDDAINRKNIDSIPSIQDEQNFQFLELDDDLEENFNQIHELSDNGHDPDQKPSDLKQFLIEEKYKNKNLEIYMVEAEQVVDEEFDGLQFDDQQSSKSLQMSQRKLSNKSSKDGYNSSLQNYQFYDAKDDELQSYRDQDLFMSARGSHQFEKSRDIFRPLTPSHEYKSKFELSQKTQQKLNDQSQMKDQGFYFGHLQCDEIKVNFIKILITKYLQMMKIYDKKVHQKLQTEDNLLVMFEKNLKDEILKDNEIKTIQLEIRLKNSNISVKSIKNIKNSVISHTSGRQDKRIQFGQNELDQKLVKKLKIIEYAKRLPIIIRSDEYRSADAHKNGGFALTDQKVLQKYRNAGKELIKQIGKQLITGNFNLTNTSFPIKCMSHKTILELIASVTCVGPAYLNAAAFAEDPVERMKYVMTASVAFVYPTHHFDKPLNPVLGETFQAELPDGSNVYMEQTCHKPPISHVLLEGPDQNYTWSGYSGFSAKAYLNSIVLNVYGSKQIIFKDGTKIVYNNQGDAFNNTFFGILNHQINGRIEFKDEQNGVTAYYEIGNNKKKAQDFFTGEIFLNNKKVSDVSGNYMGYIEFDKQRYWDLRDQVIYDVVGLPLVQCLNSDSRYRIDSQALLTGDVEQAQKNKEILEHLQRHDRANREAAEKRRSKGGAKYVYKN
ncbi:UNKNOWN [Stylonychia lemnae]|uniref:Uncharacterized protein n=1 Tax=Stylonychia lemnae TaxID=5949 RepID=A0A078AVF4_STYLE|nr:UNKNOWN [Stylonychia lemnae]|eukprot:CDW86164.1 UNKNOWN [Stylonychia lemnae]